MQINPGIILSGQQPDFVNTLARSTQAAQMANQNRDRNALRQLFQTQGPQIMAGEGNALNALAQIDPNAALGIQGARQDMQAQQQRMGILSAAEKRAVQEHAMRMSAAERGQEIERTRQGLLMGMKLFKDGNLPGLNQMLASFNLEPLQSLDDFPYLAARYDGFLKTMTELRDYEAGPKPLSAPGKVQADIKAGVLPPDAAIPKMTVQITGQAAAARGLDPNKVWNVAPDGKISEVGGGGVNVTTNVGGTDEFYGTLDKKQGEMFAAMIDTGTQVPQKIALVDEMGRILSDQSTPEGIEAALKSAAGEFGIPTEGLSSLQAVQAIINRLVPEQRAPGSGPMSDADLALFKQSLPRLINTRDGNLTIVRTLRGIAEYQAQQARIAEAVANREMSPAEGRAALQEITNPLQSFRANSSAPVTIGGYTIKAK